MVTPRPAEAVVRAEPERRREDGAGFAGGGSRGGRRGVRHGRATLAAAGAAVKWRW